MKANQCFPPRKVHVLGAVFTQQDNLLIVAYLCWSKWFQDKTFKQSIGVVPCTIYHFFNSDYLRFSALCTEYPTTNLLWYEHVVFFGHPGPPCWCHTLVSPGDFGQNPHTCWCRSQVTCVFFSSPIHTYTHLVYTKKRILYYSCSLCPPRCLSACSFAPFALTRLTATTTNPRLSSHVSSLSNHYLFRLTGTLITRMETLFGTRNAGLSFSVNVLHL